MPVGGPYKFSSGSAAKLLTCDPKLRIICEEAIKLFDFRVTEGFRTVTRQQQLYAQGRTKPGQIVTEIDGVKKKGKHNYFPSKAVDIDPWPVNYNDRERYMHLAGIMLGIAHSLKIKIRWGGDFDKDDDFKDRSGWDLPHYEIED